METFLLKPQEGIAIAIRSEIPGGCGMGSSASIAASVFHALATYFGLELERDRFIEYTLATEKLQHGRPSGVDPYAVIHGGTLRFQAGEATPVDAPRLRSLSFFHTGQPESTTGECVMQVAQHYENAGIWQDFEGITQAFEESLSEASHEKLIDAIKENHRLLVTLGVVPQAIQDVISSIESRGGAAKLCGAGAVRGDAGGILLAFSAEGSDALSPSCPFPRLDVNVDHQGLRS